LPGVIGPQWFQYLTPRLNDNLPDIILTNVYHFTNGFDIIGLKQCRKINRSKRCFKKYRYWLLATFLEINLLWLFSFNH
jgi:hypothetical protein